MRMTLFATVFNAETYNQAEEIIGRLRLSGLHPTDLALTSPLPFSTATKKVFPVEVPLDEAEQANSVLRFDC